MKCSCKAACSKFGKTSARGFTLAEVVISLGILGLVVTGMLYGYVNSARLAEWNAYSLAAQSMAFQGVEAARAAKWDPQAWPRVDELGVTNFVQVDILDVPVHKTPTYATNYVSVSWISLNPPLRQLRSDCVWRLAARGLFTNTVITLRAADQ
jgi:prepilin-type N-terminal cleavage/methylation domain-containing protein